MVALADGSSFNVTELIPGGTYGNKSQVTGWSANYGGYGVYVSGGIIGSGANIDRLADAAVLWGQGIPTTWGKRKLKRCGVLQVGAIRENTYITQTYIVKGRHSTQETNTFQNAFFYDLAISLGYPGDAGANSKTVNKIWQDGVVIYDATKKTVRDPVYAIYPGNQTQGVDPTLATQNANAIPYRGQMYMVFQGLDYKAGQTDFPTYDVEFFDNVSNSMPSVTYAFQSPAASIDTQASAYDSDTDIVYALAGDGAGGYAYYSMVATSGQKLGFITIANNLSVGSWSGAPIKATAFFKGAAQDETYVLGSSGLGNVKPLVIVNITTGQQIVTKGVGGIIPDVANDKYGLVDRWQIFDNARPDQHRIFAFGVTTTLENSAYLFKVYDSVSGVQLTRLWYSAGTSTYNNAVISPSLTDSQGTSYAFIIRDTTIDLVRITSADKVTVQAAFATLTYNAIAAFPCTDGSFVVFCQTGGNTEIRKVKLSDGSTVFSITGKPMPSGALNMWQNQSFTTGKEIAWVGGGYINILNLASGQLDQYTDASGVSWGSDQPFYDSITKTFNRPTGSSLVRVTGQIPTGQNISLSTYLRQVCVNAGYNSGDVQITGITESILGSIIYPPFDLDDFLKNMGAVYNFDVFETDGKITISRKTASISATPNFTIQPEDRAVLQEGGSDDFSTLRVTRISEDKIPSKITLKYIDVDYDYAINSFTWQRATGTTNSTRETVYQVPIVMTATDAANLVNNMLTTIWGQRMSAEFRLGQKYLTINPGDIVKLPSADGTYVDYVKVQELSINADYSISLNGTTINTDSITLPAFTDDSYSQLPANNVTPNDGKATVIVADVPPILYEGLTPTELGQYLFAIPGSRGQLISADVQKDLASAGYATIFSVLGVTYGTLGYALATTTQPNTILRTDSLTFTLRNGNTSSFSTCTELQMLAGTNRILVGKPGRWEVIGFTSVSVNTTLQQVTLTGLIRGLNGTDINVGNHVIGDYVVLYNQGSVVLDTVDTSQLNKTVKYRAAGTNYPFSLSTQTSFVINGNSDKPWSVTYVYMTRDGSNNLTLTWARRSRSEFTLTDGTGTAPLDETSEVYEMEIINGSGTVVRTVTGLTSPTYTYSAANQTTDGFSPPLSSLRVKIYQISSVVGRGFVKDITVNV